MYQNNRNLFSFFAVLVAAGLITAVGGLFLYLIGRSGSGPSSVGSSSAIAISSPSANLPAASTSTRDIANVVSLQNSRLQNSQAGAQVTSQLLGDHRATILSVASNSASSLIASGGDDNSVKLWQSGSLEPLKLLAHSGRVSNVAFTPNGKQLVTGSGAGEIRLWDLATGELATTLFEPSGRILSLAISADSSQLASSSSSGTLKIWQVAEGSTAKAVKTLLPIVLPATDSPATDSPATDSPATDSPATNSPATNSPATNLQPNPQINALSFSPANSQRLISGDQAGTIKVWDIPTGKLLMTLEGNGDQIVSLAVSSDGQRLASGSYDKTIRIWNLQSGTLLQTLKGHNFAIADVAFSPDGKVLASASYDESIKTWDWATGTALCTLKGHSSAVYSIAFTHSGKTLVSGGADGTVRLWDLSEANNRACLTP
jgi:WD40 repeat protein